MQRPALKSWRFYSVAFVMLVLAALLLWRIASLQVLPDADRGFKFLQSQGEARTLRTEPISAYRGAITDRNGEPLAVSTPVESIWVNPQTLLQTPQRWAQLSQALGWDRGKLESRLTRFSHKEFMYVERHMPPQEAQKILALKIPGVHSQREYQRFYPTGDVAAQLVGITDIDDRGQEGMELAYDAWLSGESGSKQVIKDLHGRTVKDLGLVKAARSGRSLALSIDLRLQYLAHRELKKAVNAFKAKAGSVVVLDVHTGEVLAMANQPTYNPNDRSHLNPASLRNRAITDVFEPGSTVKPLAMTAMLETKRFTPQTKIDTSPGWMVLDGKTLKDPINHGVIDLATVIQKSSQIGMSKMSLKMDPEVIRNSYVRFGLGQGTGTGFPGEAVGILPDHAHWSDIQRATYVFGYGLNLTLLQLAHAYSIFAAGGIEHPISLLRTDKKVSGKRVVAAKYAHEIMAMLDKVVSRGGTAPRAKVESYPVAGKTGTAHKSDAGGYSDSRYVGSFVGIAPSDHPRIVVAVMIDEPMESQYYGGQVAAPVFANITGAALRILQEPPRQHSNRIVVHKKAKTTPQLAQSGGAVL